MRRNRQKVSKLRDNRLKLPRDQQTSMQPDQPVAAPSAITFSRRDFLKLMGCTIVNTPSAMQAIGQVGIQQRKQVIYLPNFAASVLRPEDLLVLCFEFFNLILKTGEDKPARLVREKAGVPAYIAVHFPPQNIAEEAFFETAVNPDNPDEISFPVSGAYRPEGIPDDPDVATGDECSPKCPSSPVRSRIAGPSRLVFTVPDEINEIDYTLPALLQACQEYEQSVANRAQPRPKPPLLTAVAWEPWMRVFTADELSSIVKGETSKFSPQRRQMLIRRLSQEQAIRSGLIQVPAKLLNKPALPSNLFPPIEAPGPHHTAIEAPWRLILSPSIFAAWAHSFTPVVHNERTELWHTRLGVRIENDDGTVRVDEQNDYYRTLRAIWSPDYNQEASPNYPSGHDPKPPTNPDDFDPFRMSLDKRDRHEVVALTSDPNIQNWRKRYIQAERLMLTGLGAWMNTRYAAEVPDGVSLSVEEWRHRGTMGRDHYVRVVYKGYLFPFGHRASLIKITERKFYPETNGNIAYLRQRMYIVVRQPEKDYTETDKIPGIPHEGRKMPFQRVRIITLVTPNLDDPTLSGSRLHTNLGRKGFWPRMGGKDFLFHVIGVDWDEQRIEFTAPLIFVDNEYAFNGAMLFNITAAHYDQDPQKERHTRALNGQKVAFALSSEGKPGDTALETETIGFSAFIPSEDDVSTKELDRLDQPRFYPVMKEAKVHIPALKQLVDGPARIKFDNTYLSKGVDSNDNKGQVFVQVFKPDADAPLPLIFGGNGKKNAAKAGGIITPNMAITGLSRLLGPVGGSLGSGEGESFIPSELVKNATFNPAEFFSEALEANILGGIPLSAIIEPIDDFTNDLEKIPKLVSRTIKENAFSPPEAIETTFKWTPQLRSDNDILVPHDLRGLAVDVWIKTNLTTGKSEYRLKGELKSFTIKLFPSEEIIGLKFNYLSFTAKNGQKPEVSANLPEVRFLGKLGFLNKLQDYIPIDGFCGSKSLEVTEEGIKAGYSLAIPSVGFGVFSLRNISLSAALNLPFNGDPARVRFNFATRENQFALSVAMFTGEGYFCIAVGTDGIEHLEASLSFGASISLDLGIASGGVEVLGGVIYEMDGEGVGFICFLRMGGHLEVFGWFGVSVEFNMNLGFESPPRRLYGQATLAVEVDFGLWSVDVDLTVERELAASPPPTFGDLMSPDDWRDYCLAFVS